MPVTAAKGYDLQATGSNSGTWGSTLNTDVIQIIDNNLGAISTIALTNSNVTLSSTEAQSAIVRLTGTISAAIQITTSCIGFFWCENRTSGVYAVTVTNGVGTPVTVPQGYSVAIIADSANGCRLANDPPASSYVAGSISASALESSAVTTAKIADDAVTYDKIQNVTTGRLLGRTTASSGNVEEITPGNGITLSSQTISLTNTPGSVYLSTTTVSGSSQLAITANIDSTYNEYELHVSNLQPSTSGVGLLFQVSTDGGSNYKTTGYASAVLAVLSSGNTSAGNNSSGVSLAEASLSGGVSNSASYGWRGLIRVFPIGTTNRKNVVIDGCYTTVSSSRASRVVGVGYWDGDNSEVNAVRIVASSGNISGTVRLVGIKNS